jgi:hypothetical protein
LDLDDAIGERVLKYDEVFGWKVILVDAHMTEDNDNSNFYPDNDKMSIWKKLQHQVFGLS